MIPVKLASSWTFPGAVRSSVTTKSSDLAPMFPERSVAFALKRCKPSLNSDWDWVERATLQFPCASDWVKPKRTASR